MCAKPRAIKNQNTNHQSGVASARNCSTTVTFCNPAGWLFINIQGKETADDA